MDGVRKPAAQPEKMDLRVSMAWMALAGSVGPAGGSVEGVAWLMSFQADLSLTLCASQFSISTSCAAYLVQTAEAAQAGQRWPTTPATAANWRSGIECGR